MPNALLFDLDGVLVDLNHVHEKCFINAWNKHCPEYQIDPVFHSKYLDSRNTYGKIDYLQKLWNITVDRQVIFNVKQDETTQLLELEEYSTRFHSIFNRLQNEGYLLGCVSNSIKNTVHLILRKLGIFNYMNVILSNEDSEHPKPAPDLYLKAMNILNVEKDSTYIFEDSLIGQQAAISSGAHVITVRDSKDITYDFIKRSVSMKKRYRPWESDPNWKLKIVIPMAGDGTRFRTAGYSVSKPLIPIQNKPMISWVLDNLKSKYTELQDRIEYHLCVRTEAIQEMKTIPGVFIHEIPKLTEGPACTVLIARSILERDAYPLLIANSDQFLEWDFDAFIDVCTNPSYSGCISTFYNPDSTDTKWSFAQINADGHVTRVAEKEYIGPAATTGIYYWQNGLEFVKYADTMISNNDRVKNEFYVGPVYNYAIRDMKFIRVFDCKKMWGLGVPSDLEKFKRDYLSE